MAPSAVGRPVTFVALLAGLIIAAPCRAQLDTPVPPTFFAVNPWDPGDYPKVSFGMMAHAQFSWPTIEPARGDFHFEIFDAYVADAEQHGLMESATDTVHMAITLGLTPSWAVANPPAGTCDRPTGTAGLTQCTVPPDDVGDWSDFLTHVIHHYNGETRNGIHYPHIEFFELWNEADDTGWWSGTNADMLALAQAAYPIIHTDPHSQLLTPSVTGPIAKTTAWMAAYLQAGGYLYADAGAYHGYLGQALTPYPMPEEESSNGYGSVITKAAAMRATFDANHLAGRPIFQTEGGWGKDNVTDPDLQVAWLARYYLLQAGLRSTLNLQMAAWFAWAGPAGWGVIEQPSGDPTAAGQAYSRVYDWVVGANIGQPCSVAADGVTWSCSLRRAAGYSAQAVWNTQGAASYVSTAPYTQYRCLNGPACLAGDVVPIAPGAPVTIGIKPILLESHANVCLLYDPRSVQGGSTIPIKVELCDGGGADLSSAEIPLHATGIIQTSTSRSSAAADSGNSNPDGNFRFDATLGPSGGYVFNLSTKELTTGTYTLNFTTSTGDPLVDSFVYSAPFQVR